MSIKEIISNIHGNKSGFTLIEVLIVVAVMGILSVIMINGYVSFQKSNELSENSKIVISFMRETQKNSISQKLGKKWGIKIEGNDTFTIFEDPWETSVSKKSYNLPPSLQFDNFSINGGGSFIIFNKITGETDNYGTASQDGANSIAFRISRKQETGFVKIVVTKSGRIEAMQ